MFGFSSFSKFPFSTITITVNPNPPLHTGGDDGWTRKELKRYKELQKKRQEAELARIEAVRLQSEKRKQGIADLVSPPKVSKHKQKELQSNQQVSEDIPSEVTDYDAIIASLVSKEQDLLKAIALRQAKVALETEMALLEAKRLAEQDDEEALLALLL
jgi:hypothetical protein